MVVISMLALGLLSVIVATRRVTDSRPPASIDRWRTSS
jgi:hypothetical protein